jgi:hypothetical protein
VSLLLASTNVISPAVLDKITSAQPKVITQRLAAPKCTTQKPGSQLTANRKQAPQQLTAQKLAAKKLTPQRLAAQKLAAQKMITHLFQSKSEPRVTRTTIYDGPFKHGSPMLTHQEDTAAIRDCFASFHLPNESAGFSNAI